MFGGNGYVDDGVMGRLFREAPVNSIWEGSGNVMCLDVMRAMGREPAATMALLEELLVAGGEMFAFALNPNAASPVESAARSARVLGTTPDRTFGIGGTGLFVASACPSMGGGCVCATRFDPHWGRVVGAIDTRCLEC